jgi:hypothetical protein
VVEQDDPTRGIGGVHVIASAGLERTGGAECPKYGEELTRVTTDQSGYFTLVVEAKTQTFTVVHCETRRGAVTERSNAGTRDGGLRRSFVRMSRVNR